MNSKPKPMLWSSEHDEMMCREILVVNPFTGTRRRTIQRGAKWGIIAENLNKINEIYLEVDKRAVSDRYNHLAKGVRTKIQKEKLASGIETDMSDVEKALEEIIEIEDAAETEQQDVNVHKREKENKDRQDAENVRNKAMETLGQTLKRKSDEEVKAPIKRRSNGNDAVNYLKEKNNVMQQWHKEELELKRMQMEAENKKHQEFMQVMFNQQQQMKQQNDMMIALVSQIVQKK